jgi:hypothetical protein
MNAPSSIGGCASAAVVIHANTSRWIAHRIEPPV